MSLQRTSHAVYDTRYHLVWAPKYRKWVLQNEVRDTAEEILKEILAVRDCQVEEMEIAKDHIHIFVSIPPKYSIGEMVRTLKCISAKEIFRRHPNTTRSSSIFWSIAAGFSKVSRRCYLKGTASSLKHQEPPVPCN